MNASKKNKQSMNDQIKLTFFLFGSKIDELKDNFESSNVLHHTSSKKKTGHP
jgi:hypothetical protein